MNDNLCAVLPHALGFDPTHIVTAKDGAHLRGDGLRPTFLYINAIKTLATRDPSKAVRFTVRGNVMDDTTELLLAAALSAGRDVSLMFHGGMHAVIHFLTQAYAVADGGAL